MLYMSAIPWDIAMLSPAASKQPKRQLANAQAHFIFIHTLLRKGKGRCELDALVSPVGRQLRCALHIPGRIYNLKC